MLAYLPVVRSVVGLEFRVLDLGLAGMRVRCSGFRIRIKFRVSGLGFRVGCRFPVIRLLLASLACSTSSWCRSNPVLFASGVTSR